jgi:hypothetical protein
MAAPAATVRTDPGGIMMENGYRTLITHSLDPDLSIWEIEVGSAGLDGGEPIDTTTQHNDVYRTRSPRALISYEPFDVKFAYEAGVQKSQLETLINKKRSGINASVITETLPDGSTLAYYGFFQKVSFDPKVEGELPTGTLTVVPTNFDPVNRVEAGPTLVEVEGT